MGVLTATIAVLNVLKEYLELKNKSYYFDLHEKYCKLIEQTEKEMKVESEIKNSDSQNKAKKLFEKLIDLKKVKNEIREKL